MDGQDSDDPKQGTADMTIVFLISTYFLFKRNLRIFALLLSCAVQNLLQQMQSRFQTMSESIVSKIDEMGGRINELEQSISELRTEIGAEGSPSPLPPSKKADEAKPEEGSA